MVSKVLRKMEVLRGFIHIPTESRSELIGNTCLPCVTMLNGNPARLDKRGRLWSPYLKNRFSIGTVVVLNKTENGYHVAPYESKQEYIVSEMRQQKEVMLASPNTEGKTNIYTELSAREKIGEETRNKIIFGDCRNMREIPDSSVHLMVTSPPYFNAPFDYPELFKDYNEYLDLIRGVARELRRVLAPGRIACFVTQDVRIKGKLYPVAADIVRVMVEEAFNYRDRIIWRKPEGYIRISRRSGVQIQHPYPMYFYPDNLFEEILILQKGKYHYPKINPDLKSSQINMEEFNEGRWYLSVWDITNVLPLKGRLEEGIAAFPDEIPYRLIKLFSYKGETVLDPFMGSGTTLKVALELGRKTIGYELDLELLDIVKKKLKIGQTSLSQPSSPFEVIIREDAKHLRTRLQEKVSKQRSVTKR